MRLAFSALVILAIGVSSCPSLSAEKSEQMTLTGWVLDSACAFTKGLSKPISRECALACAKSGSPLVILQDNGSIYWPISEAMPAQGQNERLTTFAGKRVTATGRVYVRGGSKAIVIQKIVEGNGP
jgi:hypothetical protein